MQKPFHIGRIKINVKYNLIPLVNASSRRNFTSHVLVEEFLKSNVKILHTVIFLDHGVL